jgi:hypothetical protein
MILQAKLQRQRLYSYRIGTLVGWVSSILGKIWECLKGDEEYFLSPTRYPLGNAFFLELRNFLGRIELLYTKFLWNGVDLGATYQEQSCECLFLNTQTIENSHYIEQLKATLPWATSVDYQMFVMTRNAQAENNRRLAESGVVVDTPIRICKSCQLISSSIQPR